MSFVQRPNKAARVAGRAAGSHYALRGSPDTEPAGRRSRGVFQVFNQFSHDIIICFFNIISLILQNSMWRSGWWW